MIEIIRARESLQSFLLRLKQRLPCEDSEIRKKVQNIIDTVQFGGERAVRAARLEFEGIEISEPLLISPDEPILSQKALLCSEELRAALRLSIERVRRYHEIQREQDKMLADNEDNPGSWSFVSRAQPLDRVAVYVPGGQAFYPSSVIMSVVPAKVAGVSEVIVVTPHRSLLNPAFAATVQELGVSQILATGGAHGVAAVTFGFEGFDQCDKIVGPGNIYVATAKHLLSGRIGIDGFAGPSEILVLGDGSSNPKWIAADLLAQAEHDEQASSIFATTSEVEAVSVVQELEVALSKLGPRRNIAAAALRNFGAVIKLQDRSELVWLSNRINPEHLHIHTKCALDPEGRKWWSKELKGVGAVFFGRYCSEAFGDYLAGPSHVLPTAGTARFSSPLGVYDFVRRSSLIWMDEIEASRLAQSTALLADAEDLPGHAQSARLRDLAVMIDKEG